jgi:hypothetical protein
MQALKIIFRDADNKRYQEVLSDRRRYDELMTMDKKSEIVVDELNFLQPKYRKRKDR